MFHDLIETIRQAISDFKRRRNLRKYRASLKGGPDPFTF